tara:strand:- start:516 stop:662 length:147 start_codon:yes stop_codon:yes gene_type:complete
MKNLDLRRLLLIIVYFWGSFSWSCISNFKLEIEKIVTDKPMISGLFFK